MLDFYSCICTSFQSKLHLVGIFLGLIWGRILAPSQFKNEQKLPKMVYIILNFLVLHFGGYYMKIQAKIAKLHAFIHIFIQIFMSFMIKAANMSQLSFILPILIYLYPPQTLFVGGILFSRCPSVRPSVCPSVRPSVRPSVTLCFLNILKSHCLIFIKPCKHVHICKTNFLDKKVRARGQFYQSYFPL